MDNYTNIYHFRYAVGDKGMMIMIMVLLLTFLALKKLSPTLPAENQYTNEKCLTKWIGEIFCGIFICFIIYAKQFLVADMYLFSFLFEFTLRVVFPAYYIYSFPSLSKYVSTYFKKNVFVLFLKER